MKPALSPTAKIVRDGSKQQKRRLEKLQGRPHSLVLLGFSTIKHVELSSPNLLVSDKFSECSFAVILIPDSAESYRHKAQKTNQQAGSTQKRTGFKRIVLTVVESVSLKLKHVLNNLFGIKD